MRRSWTGPALLAIAALLLAGSGAPAHASLPDLQCDPSPARQALDTPGTPTTGPIVIQYGDPDDAITGNRGPLASGQSSIGDQPPLKVDPTIRPRLPGDLLLEMWMLLLPR